MISERKRRCGMTQEGCNVKLSVVKSKTKGYMVKQFVEGHSHTFATPRKVHLKQINGVFNISLEG